MNRIFFVLPLLVLVGLLQPCLAETYTAKCSLEDSRDAAVTNDKCIVESEDNGSVKIRDPGGRFSAFFTPEPGLDVGKGGWENSHGASTSDDFMLINDTCWGTSGHPAVSIMFCADIPADKAAKREAYRSKELIRQAQVRNPQVDYTGRCSLSIGDKNYLSSEHCNIHTENDGSFQIGEFDNKFSAAVTVIDPAYPVEGDAVWNGEGGASHLHDTLGRLVRNDGRAPAECFHSRWPPGTLRPEPYVLLCAQLPPDIVAINKADQRKHAEVDSKPLTWYTHISKSIRECVLMRERYKASTPAELIAVAKASNLAADGGAGVIWNNNGYFVVVSIYNPSQNYKPVVDGGIWLYTSKTDCEGR